MLPCYSLSGCTTLIAVSGILRTLPGRRGSGPGRWAGWDPATGRPRPRMRALASARRCCHLHRAGPLMRPGTVPTARASQGRAGRSLAATSPGPLRGRISAHSAHSPTGGVGRCLLAEGHGCLLGCLGPRRIAGTIATAGPARGGRGAGSGRELPRVDHHQRRMLGCGSMVPDLSLARLLGGRLALLIPSSARLSWLGFTGSGAVWLPPLRVGPGQRAGQTGRPSGSLESGDPLAWATCATVTARGWQGAGVPAAGGRVLPGQRSATRTRVLAAAGRADAGEAAGPGAKAGPGPRPPGLDYHVPGRARVAAERLV
jgi:hypothetical protein